MSSGADELAGDLAYIDSAPAPHSLSHLTYRYLKPPPPRNYPPHRRRPRCMRRVWTRGDDISTCNTIK